MRAPPFRWSPLGPSDARRPAALRARARADGCLFLPGLLPPERWTPLRDHVEAALVRRGWLAGGRTEPSLRLGRSDDARWIEFLGEVVGSAPWRTLAAAPELRRVLRTVFGSEPAPHAGDVCRLVSPGAQDLATPPHQDAAYLADSAVWVAWTPLADCPRALGPLALLPGSHRRGLLPHAPPGDEHPGIRVPRDATWRSADLRAGDVILFSALTVHRALPNVTADRLRVSADFRYRPSAPASDGVSGDRVRTGPRGRARG